MYIFYCLTIIRLSPCFLPFALGDLPFVFGSTDYVPRHVAFYYWLYHDGAHMMYIRHVVLYGWST